MKRKNINPKTFRITLCALLISLAFLLSYVESLIPAFLIVPGVKLGLANLVVFVALYLLGWKAALRISVVRTILVSFTFGNLFAFVYSLVGGLLSFGGMCLCKKLGCGKIAVSMIGGVLHNIGQILTAAVLLETSAILSWLPVLFLSGSAAGALIGLAGGLVLIRVEPHVRKKYV